MRIVTLTVRRWHMPYGRLRRPSLWSDIHERSIRNACFQSSDAGPQPMPVPFGVEAETGNTRPPLSAADLERILSIRKL